MPKLRRSSRLAALRRAAQPKIKIILDCAPRRSARLAAKRRGKPNTTFIRHRPTVLDDLPMHVIQHQIFSYLDYDSRINLNQCLPIWDRVSKKMPAESVMKHDIELRIKVMQNILHRIAEEVWDYTTYSFRPVLKGDPRMIEMIKMFKFFQEPHYFNMINIFPTFHKAVVAKINEFEVVTLEDRKGYSDVIIDNFILEITKLKSKIEKEKQFFSNASPLLGLIKPLTFI